MKLTKTANGTKIKLSKIEWVRLGRTAGWLKTAACMEHICNECDAVWFDNEKAGKCPECGSNDVMHLFDEECEIN